MPKRTNRSQVIRRTSKTDAYGHVLTGVTELLETARRGSARAVNAIMTATYWEIGRRIVEFEQQGRKRAEYGERLIERLSDHLTDRFGRGYGVFNLRQMRKFYLLWSLDEIRQTPSSESTQHLLMAPGHGTPRSSQDSPEQHTRPAVRIRQTVSSESRQGSSLPLATIASRFPLPWSHYVRLLTIDDPEARRFYETEALRGGWSVRQLDRQIDSMLFQRTMMSRKKAAALRKGRKPSPGDALTPEEEIKDPFVLEFLDLKDEYSESDLEAALVSRIEQFLMELGGEFAFVGRQRRLRIGDEWCRIDLLFFHRRLRCLVVIDLKLGKFTHADAGQMHMYLNYAKEHWVCEGENPPVGLILCASKNEAVARYALDGLPNKVLAAEYKMFLPDANRLARELGLASRKLMQAKPAKRRAN